MSTSEYSSGLVSDAESFEPTVAASAGEAEDGSVRCCEYALDDVLNNRLHRVFWHWMKLIDADPGARIAHHPEVLAAQMAHDGVRGGWFLGAENANGLRAAAILVPKTVRMRGMAGWGPMRVWRGWRLVGNRLLGDLSADGPPHDAGLSDRLIDRVAQHIGDGRGDVLVVEDVDIREPLWAGLHRLRRRGFRLFAATGLQHRLRIRLPDDPQQYWSQFSSKTRGTQRRRMRKLADAEVVCVTEPDQVPDFLDLAARVSQNSWQTQRLGPRISNDAATRRLFAVLALHGALRSYLLVRHGVPLAFLIGTQWKGWFHYEEVAYDQNFARFSPGQVLLLHVLEDLFDHYRPQWFDFGGGDAEYKRMYANHVSHSATLWIFPPSWRNAWLVKRLETQCAVASGIRGLLDRLGLKKRLRRLVRAALRNRSAEKSRGK